MERYKNKVALVTGGAGGIGRATVERLATEGASVMIADFKLEEAEKLALKLNEEGRRAKALYYNATDMQSGKEVVEETVRCFGDIDCLVNNVGGSDLKRDLAVGTLDMEYFDEVFHLNLQSMLATLRAALPVMTENRKGSIVNVASISGMLGDSRGTLYGLSKAGVINLTRYVATQYGQYGIRCNGVAPGLILTPAAIGNLPDAVMEVFLKYNAVPYLGKPEDIAATIAFLASDDARYITGQTVVADGGMGCHNPTIADVSKLI